MYNPFNCCTCRLRLHVRELTGWKPGLRAWHETHGRNDNGDGRDDGRNSIPLVHGAVCAGLSGCSALSWGRRLARVAHARHGLALLSRTDDNAVAGSIRAWSQWKGSCRLHVQDHTELLLKYTNAHVRHDTILPEPNSVLVDWPMVILGILVRL